MKVLILNGSPREKGNTSILVNEMVKVFEAQDVETEVVRVGSLDVSGCLACGYCGSHDGCVKNDIVNELNAKLAEADGFVVASPVHYASPAGTLISILDRMFYSSHNSMKMKVGACFAIARRGGTTASFDVLNKYLLISGMVVAGGDYWNNGFGRIEGEIEQDLEGLRNARTVAGRMVFLMKAIADEKAKIGFPEEEPRVGTHFIGN